MALEELITRLERDAEGRLAELRAKTDAEVARLVAEAAAEEGTQQRRELEARHRERRARFDRELVEARQRARAAVLRAKHALLERVFARARVLMPEVGLTRWKAALPVELDRSMRYLEGQPVVVRCSKDVLEPVKHHVGERAEVVEAALPSSGCIVSARDGSVWVDVTFGARLTRAEPTLAIELLAEVRP